jgi:Na+-translocating ferredoxin:NAD+ oxidoreductase subunit G
VNRAIAPGRVPARSLYGALVGIALAAGLVIAVAHELTRPIIAAKRAAFTAASVVDVLPGAVAIERLRATVDGRLAPLAPDAAEPPALFAGYDADGRLVGYAIPAQGMGYQDRIGLLYGLDVAERRLLGLAVLESRETPGLGGRVVDDPALHRSVRGLALTLGPDGRPQPLELAVPGREEPGRIDAITGATVSSRAIARIVSGSLEAWWPRLAAVNATEAADG